MPISIDLSGRKELQKKALEADLQNSELQREMLMRKLYPEREACAPRKGFTPRRTRSSAPR